VQTLECSLSLTWCQKTQFKLPWSKPWRGKKRGKTSTDEKKKKCWEKGGLVRKFPSDCNNLITDGRECGRESEGGDTGKPTWKTRSSNDREGNNNNGLAASTRTRVRGYRTLDANGSKTTFIPCKRREAPRKQGSCLLSKPRSKIIEGPSFSGEKKNCEEERAEN